MARTGGTLIEVARRCEVNPSTVSRVLNNSKHGRFSVSPVVRQKILDAARDLNYRPSMAARNLTLTRTNLVAVLGVAQIQSDQVGPIEEAVSAMGNHLDAAGYEICMQFLSSRHSAFDMPQLRVDGVAAVGARTQADVDALDALGVPYVSINGRVGANGSAVNPDDAQGARIALQHLCEIGHRRIAYLDHLSIDADHPSVFERRQAFYDGQAEFGFEVPDHHLPYLPSYTAWDSYYEPFIRAAIIAGRATAVLTYSHQGAMALCRTAHDLGLKVPGDFSVVCFNNEPVLRLFVPSITAVNVPSTELGRAAADVLLRGMAAGDAFTPTHTRMAESLVLRESTARPGQ